MFSLIALESENSTFQPIEFRDGINIILGVYANGSRKGSDVNGIGKSTIIKMIDYCLLADGPKAYLFSEKFHFLRDDHIKLYFRIGTDSYITRRGFKNKSAVELSTNGSKFEEFTDSDLRIAFGTSIIPPEQYEGISSSSWFRILMNFFIQDDHAISQRDPESPQKFSQGARRIPELFTYTLFLLGINNEKIWKFDQKTVEEKKSKEKRSQLAADVKRETGKDVSEYRAEIESIELKLQSYQERLNEFKFEKSYSEVEGNIAKFSLEISELAREHEKLSNRLKGIEASIGLDISFDVERVASSFSKLNIQFAEFIKKEISEIIEFRKSIVSNRNEFLNERKLAYASDLAFMKGKIRDLDDKRSTLYLMLNEKNAFDALKNSYELLIQEKVELANRKINVQKYDAIEDHIAKSRTKIAEIVEEIVADKSMLDASLLRAKRLFSEIVSNSIESSFDEGLTYFSILPRANTASPLAFQIEIPRGSSLGKGRFKILAYDMMLFLCILDQERSLPTFLIHDGAFHAIAHKTRINYLNYVFEKLKSFPGSQYIITLNSEELAIPDDAEEDIPELAFDINKHCIIRLSDNPEKMLFGHQFG